MQSEIEFLEYLLPYMVGTMQDDLVAYRINKLKAQRNPWRLFFAPDELAA